MTLRLRPVLDSVPAYLSGKPAPTPEGLIPYKVSSNENPFEPLPSVQEVIAKAAQGVNRYPDMAVTALTERIAGHFGVQPAQVATGTGGVGVLKQILEATSGLGDEVVFPWRSFEAYPILTTLTGAKPVPIPLTADHRHDLDAMAAAVNDRTRAVMICSPNNPTGGSVRHADLESFLNKIPSNLTVVLDEAYVDFVTSEDAIDSLRALREHENIVLLRTFSKSYGLANLRVGFSIAHEQLTTAIRKTCLPFAVSGIGQEAAIASFDADDELQTRVATLVAERTRVVGELRSQGWDIPDTDANFVWFNLGEKDTPRFEEFFESQALAVRAYKGDGVRVTIAEPPANDRLLELAGRWLQENPR